MNEWQWKVPESGKAALEKALPSHRELQIYSLVSSLYLLLIQLLVLKFTPYIIVPSLAAFIPLSALRNNAAVFSRMRDKVMAKLSAFEAGLDNDVKINLEEETDEYEIYGMGEEDRYGDQQANVPTDIALGIRRARAKRHQGLLQTTVEQPPESIMGDEGHGKENQWGDVIIEDEQNQQ